MNICGNEICVCDNYDYGDAGCEDMYRDVLGEARTADADLIARYYFWSTEHGVVLSVDHRMGKDERLPGVDYYLTPDEAAAAARDETVRVALDRGLLNPADAERLLGLKPVMDPVPPPRKVGPRGNRGRVFEVKPKPR